jgi:uncharacterized cupin superfamily protein
MAHIVNIAEAAEQESKAGSRWGSFEKDLTPAMQPRRLGMLAMRVAPGRSACPFHTHQVCDEIFYVLSGHGVLRYGEEITAIRPGDAISCPAGTGTAHQLANTGSEDLVYLSIGSNAPETEVCTYPDTGKIMVDALQTVGRLEATDYWDGEPDEPKIFALARSL